MRVKKATHEDAFPSAHSQKLAENKPENPQKPLLSSKQSRGWTLPWTLPSFTKVARGALSCVLSLLMIVSLASCRDSDVLTEKVIGDINQYEIDYSLMPASVEISSAQLTTKSEQEEESEQETEWEYEEPNYGDDATTDGETAEQIQSDTAQDSGEASEGIDEGTRSGVTSLSNDEDEGGQLLSYLPDIFGDPDEDPDADQTTQTEEQTPDTPTSSSTDSSGGSTDSGTIYNPVDGNYENIPTGTTRIAAAGPYATIVQAIGGKNALAAVNQEWLDNLPDAAFNNGDELENTVGISAWGDGTSINDETVQAIINSGAETLLVSDTYAAISQNQADTLAEAGINVVVMPPIGIAEALDEDIVTTVQVVGQLLKDAGDSIGLDSVAMASAWQQLHTQALEETLQRNGGYTTTFSALLGVNYMMTWIYQGTNSFATGSSGSLANASSNRFYVTYFDEWTSASSEYVSGQSYRTNNLGGIWPYKDWYSSFYGTAWTNFTLDLSEGLGTYIYQSLDADNYSNYAVISYYFQHSGLADIQAGNLLERGETFITATTQGSKIVWISAASTTSNPITLGDSSFPAIIVRDDEMAQHVLRSANTVDRSSETAGFYNVGQSYQVWVMPSGIDGSWTDGTFESVLVAPWSYCMLWYSSGGTMEYSDDFVNTFYETFYRCGPGGILDDTDSTTLYGGYGTAYETTCPRQ